MSGGGERDDRRAYPLLFPRFQAEPPPPPARTRKPLPRHIVKQILATRAETMLAVPPWLQQMDDRASAAIAARAERAREWHHLARWPKGKGG